MASKTPQLVTIFGATGQQGGSIARSLLQNRTDFRVRGITRNPSSDAAKALAAAGAEVVKADGWDSESMKRAFSGSWTAVINTNSDDPALDDGKRELELGKLIMDAALAAGVKVVVYSALPWVEKLTGGAVKVRLCDSKAAILEYARSLPFEVVTDYKAGWYMENFAFPELIEMFGGFPTTPDSEGYLTMHYPPWGSDEPVSLIAIAEDLGDIVHGMLLSPQTYHHKSVHGVSQLTSYEDIVKTFSDVTGKKARYVEWPLDKFETHGVHIMEEMKGLFEFLAFIGGRYFGTDVDAETPKKLKAEAAEAKAKAQADGVPREKESEMMTWEEWVRNHLM